MEQNRIGLIAGNGRFPILFAQAARKKGIEIVAIAISGETSKSIEHNADKIHWLGAGELGKLSGIILDEKLTSIVMAGQVKHKTLFDRNIKIDKAMQSLLDNVRDKKTDSLIGAIAKKLESLGVKLLDSTTFLSEYLPEKGLLTKNPLGEKILEDIDFGREAAKVIAGLDIGQSVVVKDKVLLAVEAIEGTDEAIKRGAKYGKEGIVVVKVSKPGQDMRFDIPIIGPDTIKLLKKVKAACISIEAKKTLIIDKKETIDIANRSGIGIIAS
ncbi:MAG: UDP-2,3-diacylglucosamine diphosphatase LpxI [Candidatus Omnitrophica bacterium]|nr:UDP-2,3-diacylglucosamine diphosphatase LpxI [Candidatus Omnitrophota bacterium]